MATEVWGFVEGVELAGKMATEVVRLAHLTSALPCVVLENGRERGQEGEMGTYGVEKVYTLAPVGHTPEEHTQALETLLSSYQPYACLFAASALGAEVAARLAVRLRRGLVTGCLDFALEEGRLVARRSIYGGKAQATVTWQSESPHLATVDMGIMEAIPASRVAQIQMVKWEAISSGSPPRVRHVETVRLPREEVDLGEVRGVIGVGGGVKEVGEMRLIYDLAALLDLPVGGSRVADERGLIPRARRIGMSGTSLAADVYIAVGISGATYHLMGVKNVKHIVAINTDSGAPILEVAELGIIADFREVILAVIDRLHAKP